MGPLSLPASGSIYTDANVLIYSVERIQPYMRTLDSFWLDVSVRRLLVLTSELTALEALIGPLKTGDTALVAGCALFVTNDAAFSHVPGLTVKLLRDMITL